MRYRGNLQLSREIERFLAELGSDSGQVAARLYREQVRGAPKNTNECAVARYLRAVLGADRRVTSLEVTRGWVIAHRGRRGWLRIALPNAVQEFIDLFDDGVFPELAEQTLTFGRSVSPPGLGSEGTSD